MEYLISEHKHRYSVWAAGRASSVVNCRFSVAMGRKLIEKIELEEFVENPDKLPLPVDMDHEHTLWRLQIIEEAKLHGIPFTHGVAAKLINVYLKGALVCGGYHEHPKAQALHPPIDKVLLETLKKEDVGLLRKEWHLAAKIQWSKFNSEEYESVITSIRKSIPNQPLWAIEYYWKGHQ